MEYAAKICYGLKVIFQAEKNTLNIISNLLEIYRFTTIKMWSATRLCSWVTPFLIYINHISLVFKYLSSIM